MRNKGNQYEIRRHRKIIGEAGDLNQKPLDCWFISIPIEQILPSINLRKVMIYLLTSCNTEEKIAQNIYIHNSNRNYKKLTTTTILIKKRIGIGYKNYESNSQDSSIFLNLLFTLLQ